jgi:hypothetical protein
MFAQRVSQIASRAEAQKHKLAAQDSRLQQNATISSSLSVTAEQWKKLTEK